MVNMKFVYENNQYKKTIKDKNTLIIDIIIEYSSIINKDKKELFFLCKGKKLSFTNKEKISDLKNDNLSIIVFNLNNIKENKDYTELKQIICPKCKELAIFNFDEDKISINNCLNKHNIRNISISELMKSQYINNLKCDICHNDNYLYNNKLFFCSCKKSICPLCAKLHDIAHYKI